MRSDKFIVAVASCLCASGTAFADQTVKYTYDALGRLTQSQVLSGAESGVTEVFSYDPAGNRLSFQVSGSASLTPVTLNMISPIVNITSAGVPLAVNLNASTASGTVTFTENGVFLGSMWVVDGQASIYLEGFAKGTHTITASYSGDGTHSAQTMTFTVKV
jgi:hypothetical protein